MLKFLIQIKLISVFFVFAMLGVSSAQGPSFDCAKAENRAEKYICEDDTLQKQDAAMAVLYKAALQATPEHEEDIRSSQRAWLKRRDKTCGERPVFYSYDINDVDAHGRAKRVAIEKEAGKYAKMCLQETYARRINELIAAAGVAEDSDLLRGLPKPSSDVGMYLLAFDSDDVFRVPGLCQEMERNLNRYRQQPPMMCGIEIHPDESSLTKPAWHAIAPGPEAVDLYQRFMRSPWRRMYSEGRANPANFPSEAADKAAIAKKLEEGKLRIDTAEFDLDSWSRAEKVVRVSDDYLCKQSIMSPNVHAMSEDPLYGFDPRFDNVSQVQADPFFYKGRTFFANWGAITHVPWPEESELLGMGIEIKRRGRALADHTISSFGTSVCEYLYVQW